MSFHFKSDLEVLYGEFFHREGVDAPEDGKYNKLLAAFILRAVLDHVHDIQHFGRDRARFMDATLWLESEQYAPYSFTWCCEILKLHPALLREKMYRRSLVFEARKVLKLVNTIEDKAA